MKKSLSVVIIANALNRVFHAYFSVNEYFEILHRLTSSGRR
jgi:hypothetical protein